MHAAVALVAFVLVAQLFIGIAHALLSRKAERVVLEHPFAFRDTTIKITLFKKDDGTDEHGRNIAGIKSQAAINARQGGIKISRFAFQVGKPGKGLGITLFLANTLF